MANADQMYEPDGSPFTAHTTNPVPLLLVGEKDHTLKEGGPFSRFGADHAGNAGLTQTSGNGWKIPFGEIDCYFGENGIY